MRKWYEIFFFHEDNTRTAATDQLRISIVKRLLQLLRYLDMLTSHRDIMSKVKVKNKYYSI